MYITRPEAQIFWVANIALACDCFLPLLYAHSLAATIMFDISVKKSHLRCVSTSVTLVSEHLLMNVPAPASSSPVPSVRKSRMHADDRHRQLLRSAIDCVARNGFG